MHPWLYTPGCVQINQFLSTSITSLEIIEVSSANCIQDRLTTSPHSVPTSTPSFTVVYTCCWGIANSERTRSGLNLSRGSRVISGLVKMAEHAMTEICHVVSNFQYNSKPSYRNMLSKIDNAITSALKSKILTLITFDIHWFVLIGEKEIGINGNFSPSYLQNYHSEHSRIFVRCCRSVNNQHSIYSSKPMTVLPPVVFPCIVCWWFQA